MKKAKIILATVALLGIIGGTLAFKAARFTNSKIVVTTQLYVSNSITYSTNVPFCTTTGISFVTNTGQIPALTTTWTTNRLAPTFAVTLTRVGVPAESITIPAQTTCSLTTAFLTAVQ